MHNSRDVSCSFCFVLDHIYLEITFFVEPRESVGHFLSSSSPAFPLAPLKRPVKLEDTRLTNDRAHLLIDRLIVLSAKRYMFEGRDSTDGASEVCLWDVWCLGCCSLALHI